MRKFSPIDAAILLFITMYCMFPSYMGMRVGGVLFNAQRAMTIVMIGLLVVEAAANRRSIPRLIRAVSRAQALVFFVVVYLLFRLGSAFQSDDLNLSLNAAVADILSGTVFLYLGLFYARDLRRLDTMITALVLAAAALCVIGVFEEALGRNLVASAFPMMEVSRDAYIEIAVADKMRGTYRVQATFFHPLAFASYLVLMMPLALYCMQRAKLVVVKGFYLGVVVLMTLNALFTGSRAALLIIALIALAYWTKHSIRLLNTQPYVRRAVGIANLSLISLICVAAVPMAQHLVKGTNDDEQASSVARIVQLERGAESIAQHALLGVGPRMAGKHAGINDAFGATVDNWYLTVVVESGVIALSCFVLSLGSLLWLCRRLMKAHRHRESVANLFRAVLIGVGAFSLFLVILSLHDETFPYLFLLMGAILSMNDLAMSVSVRREPDARASPPAFAMRDAIAQSRPRP
jgi:O-antigen ligase